MVKFKKYALENGDFYKGSYNDRGLRHGSGHYLFKNGAQYIGTYRRGLKHGFGKLIYPDHTIYEGDWISNVKHGRGKYTYRNGDYYDGEWSMGNRHGLGTYYCAAKQSTFHGVWQNGYRNGPAEVTVGEYRLHGKWFGGRTVGCGTFTVPPQIMCSGYYEYNDELSNGDQNTCSVWVTTQLNAYDATRLPQCPGDYVNEIGVPRPDDVNILRTVSEVDYTTDYLLDQTFGKKDVLDVTRSVLEHSFTTKEIRDITDSILNNAVAQQ